SAAACFQRAVARGGRTGSGSAGLHQTAGFVPPTIKLNSYRQLVRNGLESHILIPRRAPMRHALGAMATLVLLALAGRAKAEEKPFLFKSGDRIVFLGDSITEQYQYSTIIELYLTTRFPKWDLAFINAGIGGDTATGGASRFAAHVLAEKPTAVTID